MTRLGYLIESRPVMPLTRRLIARLRPFLFRTFGIGAGRLSADDMAALVQASARRATRNQGAASRSSEAQAAHPGQETDTPAFKRWFVAWQRAAQQRFLDGESIVSLSGNEFPASAGPLAVVVNDCYRQCCGKSVGTQSQLSTADTTHMKRRFTTIGVLLALAATTVYSRVDIDAAIADRKAMFRGDVESVHEATQRRRNPRQCTTRVFTERYFTPVTDGAINRVTGDFYPDIGHAYVNPRTGCIWIKP